jgi:hypothetical protein
LMLRKISVEAGGSGVELIGGAHVV